ncbi:Nephrocystin-3 [Colletotrichum fructicola Nara gc5]|uniref:Nephrocystin-3 n=1 Tax=Colletotrichum fructicola (strain Nara gc5) TaxID=1213859 RepID=A0A7J6J7P8_COLFN|nr:Nephrocystin-3 [Colletotrichum fructicola Nara gc5]
MGILIDRAMEWISSTMIRPRHSTQPHKAGGKSHRPKMTQERSRDDYKVAWICPLEVEQIAAMEMLDEEHPAIPKSSADHNVYSLGSINGHNIVIAGLHQPGNCPAATVVAQMRMTFPSLRFGLLVGIGGGVPVQTDNGMIRLGHVIVSKPAGGHSGALQYDHGKARDGQFKRTGALMPPPAVLLNAAQALAVQRARLRVDPVQQNVRRIDITSRGLRRFQYPGEQNDYLFPPHYKHQHQGACNTKCDLSKRIPRTSDDGDMFVVVHRGNIASGELVVKDALRRDKLAQHDELLCFEMEAAGAIADFPCLVVRGISDYCDSHKNDMWHGYAAAVAAAYARQLFFHLPVDEVQRCSGNATQTASSFILPFKLPGVHSVNHFVARQEELGRLYNELKSTRERRTVILHGLGGMGKTQTTIAFAKKHRDDYSAVFWLDARDTTALKLSYQSLAQRIATETSSVTYIKNALSNRDLDEMVSAVKRWLDEPKNNRWLMIYDNYDDVKLHNRGSPSENETGSQVGNENDAGETGSKAYDIRPYFPETDHGAILVTTRSSTVELGQLIQLSKLGDVNDSLEILKSTSNRANLAQDRDAMALALRLDGLPLALSTAGAYLKQVSRTCGEYLRLALYSTWEISLDHIQQQSLSASMLLGQWAYFDNDDLWYELLREGRPEGPAWLVEITEDELSFDLAMRLLCEHGLVEANPPAKETGRESRGYSVHHFDVGEEEIWMFHNLGILYSDQGRLKEAEAMYERALQGKEKAWGPDHTSTLDTVNNLGNLYSDQGRLKEAEAMYERALQGKEKAWGPDHTSTLSTINNLGNLYSDLGRLKEAEAIYERALQGYEKAWGPDHTSTLDMVNNLGVLYKDQGRLKEAEAMYERALQGKEKAWGPDHTSTLSTVGNLGILYKNQGRLKEAEAMFERALQGYEKALGPDHTSTLDSVHCLGLLYKDQGRLKEAEAMYDRALQGYEKALGPDHTSTLNTVNNLGLLYKDQGRLKEAEAMYERALQGYEKALHPDTLRTYIPALNALENLGDLFEQRGATDRALEHYNRARTGIADITASKARVGSAASRGY